MVLLSRNRVIASYSPEKLASVRLRLMLRSLISDATAMTTFQDRDLGADGAVDRGTGQMVAVTEAEVMRQFVHVHSLLTQILKPGLIFFGGKKKPLDKLEKCQSCHR